MPEVRLEKARTSIIVRAPSSLNEVMKSIPAMEFDRSNRVWRLPLSPDLVNDAVDRITSATDGGAPADDLFDFMSAADALRGGLPIHVDPRVQEWLTRATARMDAVRKARRDQDPSLLADQMCELFKFQRVGVAFLVAAKRALCADEMGLGKTLEVLCAVRELRSRGVVPDPMRVLVICNNKAKDDPWGTHIEWLEPEWHWAKINVGKGLGPNTEPGYYVINWEKLQSKVGLLAKVPWDAIIADELHKAKRASTATAKALHKLDSPIKLATTGTPIKNRRPELWSQLHWLDPGRFPSYWRFVDMYCETELQGGPKQAWKGKKPHRVIVGEKNDDMLVKELETIIIARDLDDPDVDMELPSVMAVPVPVDLGDKQRKAYDEMKEEFVAWLEDEAIVGKNWLTQALRLKQISGSLGIFARDQGVRDSAKIEAWLEDFEDSGQAKWVVMSQFREIVNEVTHFMKEMGIAHCEMVGGGRNVAWTPKAGERQAPTPKELYSYFNTDDVPRVFIATTQTGGESITLTGAHHFAFMDLLWAPTDNWQAWKRIHRGGQKEKCFVHAYLARDTIDYELILPMLANKIEIIQRVRNPELVKGQRLKRDVETALGMNIRDKV